MLQPSSLHRSLLALLIVTWTTISLGAQPRAKIHSAKPDTTAASSTAKDASSTPQPLLPETFAGWQQSGATQQSGQPSTADAPDAVALQEYGFTRYQVAHYTRDDGSLEVRAMEFADATGAFGAFTFYRRPTMSTADIGSGAAFDGSRVLFWSGKVLVDAKFARITPMSAGELRDLITQLPQTIGNQGTLPTLPRYLPAQHLQPRTVQYAIGPAAYQLSGGVLPAALVDFGRSAEVVTAQYDALGGTGTLTIINYPTPEIALDRQHAIEAYIASHGSAQNPWTTALTNSNPDAIRVRRSGPLVAVTSGSYSSESANELLQRVHYEVSVTMGRGKERFSDPRLVAQIILGVAFLVAVFALIAIVLGVSLGAGRAAWQRTKNKSGLPEDDSSEFIRLNLKR